MRQSIVAGNWKMFKTAPEALDFARAFSSQLPPLPSHLQVCLFPNFLSLPILTHELASQANLHVGAQNCHAASEGAFTGETSVEMLRAVGATHVLVGHSERREYFHETNEILLEKVKKVISMGLTPIYCCGEGLADRKAGEHYNWVGKQIEEVVCQLSAEEAAQVVVAYEPIWAIGTGETASPEQAQEMHAHIRTVLNSRFGDLANNTSILYGGSVKPGNAPDLFAQTDIDGGLVGGASLKPDDFLQIVQAMLHISQ